ncbi:hypothetical protein QVD99_006258 [Batrachochytrium dendrobatidis]|nr:hypothetical protein O5D80_003398 [Batrachochytrium dendrobatidis]KAK5667043.1 hypothetical protein QVD99_006258 [Batrachochytrium dendrobatidis]
MPYSGKYSLATRCLTEFLGTALAIFLGDSVIANELLPLTKGHSMGFGWIATAFGMAFTLSILMFGYASAHVNPAMTLTLFIINKLSFVDCICLILSQLAGGFMGAVAMFIVYLPHFRTIPEPPASTACGSDTNANVLLRTRDAIDVDALRVASYNTKSSASASKSFSDILKEAKYYLTSQSSDSKHVFNLLSLGTLDLAGVEVAFPDDPLKASSTTDLETPQNQHRPLQRRHSIQVSEMQRRLRRLEASMAPSASSTALARTQTIFKSDSASVHTAHSSVVSPCTHSEDNLASKPAVIVCSSATPTDSLANVKDARFAQNSARFNAILANKSSSDSNLNPTSSNSHPTNKRDRHLDFQVLGDLKTTHAEALHKAAIRAHQAAKLSAFCNRPAIYLPIHNFTVEVIGTTMLCLGALLLELRFSMAATAIIATNTIPAETVELVFHNGLAPFFIGVFIQTCIFALGGPTGFTANPARDIGPRFAHWILPVPGKGASEWNFCGVVTLGTFSGGVVAAVLYMGLSTIP